MTAPRTPWITYGGSLAGAESAFTVKNYGGSGQKIVYGGIGASAVINALLTYPQWYNPIQKYAPQDCVASINGIIDNFDALVDASNTGAIQQFQDQFGLGQLSDLRDFAMTIAFPIGGPMNYPTNTWQELNWNSTYGSRDFFYFCSNITNLHPPENNTAADYVLSNYTNGVPWTGLGNYAAYVKKFIVPACTTGRIDSTDEGCFSTQNQTYWADPTSSSLRSYLYSTCTELGAYQVAQPDGKPTLLSRVVQADYTQQWCAWAFPPGQYNSVSGNGPNLTHYNQYGGFNLTAERLALIDGDQDVWLDVCYHSHLAPDRYPVVRADEKGAIDEYLIAGAGHHWDSAGILDVEAETQFIREAHLWEIRTVARWLNDFTPDWHTKS